MQRIEPSLRGLKLLSALSDDRGLVRTARRLRMSQSAASHALAALERNIGASLVVRSADGLRLSETGRRLLPHVKQILDGLDCIRAEVSSLAGLQKGVLRLAAVPSVGGTILPRMIGEFNARFPGIDVALFEGTDDEVAAWVAAGAADAGFAALPAAGVQTQEITRDEWIALVPSRYRGSRNSVSLPTLSREKFLLSDGGCEHSIRRLFADAGLELPPPHLRIKQMSTLHAMVAQGLGVSIVPTLALQKPRKGFRTMHLAPRRFRHIGLLLSLERARSPALEAWIASVNAERNDPDAPDVRCNRMCVAPDATSQR